MKGGRAGTLGRKAVLAVCLGSCALALGGSANGQESTLITFDAPGAGTGSLQGTEPTAITPRGEVMGTVVTATTDNSFVRHADGTLITFSAPGAVTQGTIAFAINPQGTIVGDYGDSNFVYHGFVRAPDGAITILDVPEAGTGAFQGTLPAAINAQGVIAGSYYDANNGLHGFVRAPGGAVTPFDVPGSGTGPSQGPLVCSADCLTPEGTITGYYFDANFELHGFVRAANGTVTTFDAPGAAQGTLPFGLNSAGEVTGAYLDASLVYHGFVRAPGGAITTFDGPGAGAGSALVQGTIPACISPSGVIVGYYVDTRGVAHGFARNRSGTLATFDVPGAGTGPNQGTFAYCNNPANAITGYYVDSTGTAHGFLRSADE